MSAIVFGIGYGLALTIKTTIATLLPPTYPLMVDAATGLLFICTGMVFGVAGSAILKLSKGKNISFDPILGVFYAIAIAMLIILAAVLPINPPIGIIYFVSCIGGIGLISAVPFAA
jgi:hypothetical protein